MNIILILNRLFLDKGIRLLMVEALLNDTPGADPAMVGNYLHLIGVDIGVSREHFDRADKPFGVMTVQSAETNAYALKRLVSLLLKIKGGDLLPNSIERLAQMFVDQCIGVYNLKLTADKVDTANPG